MSSTNLAILFADISGSTALYERLGDIQARRIIATCMQKMLQVVHSWQGTLVKTIGDEIMCTFAAPLPAVQAACALQQMMQGLAADGGVKLQIRVGCHYGPVICEGGDVFGDTVNVAARIAGSARAQQIITSEAVVAALPPALQQKTHRLTAADFKGKQQEMAIFIVAWNSDDEERTHVQSVATTAAPQTEYELLLAYGGQRYVLGRERRQLSLGRGDACDLVVHSHLASRQHATLEMRSGKFYLVDQSVNGSFVRAGDGHQHHISRQEMLLTGNGLISPGQSFAENPQEVIQFAVVAKG